MLTYDLDKRGNKTMYEYLYELIKEDTADGKLKADEKLPSKRGLSQHLQISVKTVENAYEQLLLEGYIRSEEKRGYYVNKIAVVTGGAPGYAAPVKRFQEETYLADLTANNIRYDRFPFATWAKVMRETLTDYNTSLLKTVPFNGVLQLREAIADHLNRYRGMQVSADHIIIGAGTEYLYNRLLQLLGPDVKFGVENPGYRKITKIYDENGVDWDYVNIDDKGMKVDELRMKDINVAHVSPEHHFPIGLVMPVARRQELLNWAAEEPGRYIIEDDFDCEFRMQGKPIPSIQSRDRSHRVIYMNTFSKTMVPSLRIGYMVLPEKLMEDLLYLADEILIEADGSAHMPVKAPAEHEPVLFPYMDEVVIVMGAHAIGKPLQKVCHRVDYAKKILKCDADKIVTAADIRALAEQGYAIPIQKQFPWMKISKVTGKDIKLCLTAEKKDKVRDKQ